MIGLCPTHPCRRILIIGSRCLLSAPPLPLILQHPSLAPRSPRRSYLVIGGYVGAVTAAGFIWWFLGAPVRPCF